MKVVIRTDSSTKMGSGHVMRCLTLAEALTEGGAYVSFISRKHAGNLNHLISTKRFQVVELPQPKTIESDNNKKYRNGDNYRRWLGVSETLDAEETARAIENDKLDWLIVDHYSLGKKWESKLRPYVKNIMVIDDLANRRHDCDMLLDQNWFDNMKTRYDGLVPVGCTKLLGPGFVLLRPEIAKARKNLKPRTGKVKRVFVFFGSADPDNLTGITLRALSELSLKYLDVDVVIGENNPFSEEIKRLAKKRGNTCVHVHIDNIATIMAKADLALGSGGGSTWEKLALLLTGLTITTSENQRLITEPLERIKGLLLVRNVDKVSIKIIQDYLLKIINIPSYSLKQRNQLINFINVDGAKLVTEWLIGNLTKVNWEVRKASKKDMMLYWDWVNDSEVRNNAINKKSISWENHIEWFRSKLVNKNCSLYLIHADKKPVGQVRFEYEGNFAKIDYSIARQFRGRKLGNKILNITIEKFQKSNSIKILGEVLPGNIASAKTFESLGFSMKINRGNKIYTKEVGGLTEINA